MSDTTVVYFTSNQEKPSFEKKIQAKMLETIGNLPLISVSQKPMDFGENICAGNVGVTNHNAWRQLQIGAEAADTKYICAAEADYLYSWEYFNFIPGTDDAAWRPDNIWVLFARRGTVKIFAKKPKGTETAIVVGRDYLLKGIERMLSGELWSDAPVDQSLLSYAFFHNEIPIVTFKTDENMHRAAPYLGSSVCREIPYWGKSHDLIEEYA